MSQYHLPVMLSETIEGLNINENGIYVDGTVGGGGHSEGIVKLLKNGKLICNDMDSNAIRESGKRLEKYKDKITYINDNYKNIENNLKKINVSKIDGIVLDLGVSSHQIDDVSRGFSYMSDSSLDMRMNQNSDFSAYDVVNAYSQEELADIFFKYGEEKFARFIAKSIVEQRKLSPINTSFDLVEIVRRVYQRNRVFHGGHPAKRVFQAIRIEVNDELSGLYDYIISLAKLMNEGGRICIISFHSLEDRIVKNAFIELEKDCICDNKSPICICDKVSEICILTKKPIIASAVEIDNNSRSKSAKLRIAEKK